MYKLEGRWNEYLEAGARWARNPAAASTVAVLCCRLEGRWAEYLEAGALQGLNVCLLVLARGGAGCRGGGPSAWRRVRASAGELAGVGRPGPGVRPVPAGILAWQETASPQPTVEPLLKPLRPASRPAVKCDENGDPVEGAEPLRLWTVRARLGGAGWAAESEAR